MYMCINISCYANMKAVNESMIMAVYKAIVV